MAWITTGNLRGPIGPAGPEGPQGPEGPTGPQGLQGPAGLGITFKGQLATVNDLPAGAAQGDAYLLQSDDSLQIWDAASGSWVNGGSIQGPQGIAGPAGVPGPRGTAWFTGSGEPPAELAGAMPGDIYLDEVSGQTYRLA